MFWLFISGCNNLSENVKSSQFDHYFTDTFIYAITSCLMDRYGRIEFNFIGVVVV